MEFSKWLEKCFIGCLSIDNFQHFSRVSSYDGKIRNIFGNNASGGYQAAFANGEIGTYNAPRTYQSTLPYRYISTQGSLRSDVYKISDSTFMVDRSRSVYNHVFAYVSVGLYY